MPFATTEKSFKYRLVLCFVSFQEPGPFPGIVDILGAGGGLLEYRASLLAGKGFAVMALAYYNYEDLPKGLENLHLEYFEEAVNYLLNHPQVGTSLVSCSTYQFSFSERLLVFTELDQILDNHSLPPTHTTFHSHFSQRVSMQLDITARFPAGKVVLVEIMEFYIPVFCSISLQAQTH